MAARETLNKVVTFCSIYLPPSDHVAKTDLINLIKKLPSLFVLLGDFNSHSPVWGNESYNSREQMLEDLFSEMDLCILNDGSSTYIHPTTGSTSTLDLSVCDPSLVLDYEWNIHEDLCGSDHFPIILTSNTVKEKAAPNRWNFKKADWLSFQAQCSSELTEEAVMSAEDPAGQFTDLLIQAADKAIPKTRFSKKLPKVPWFNDSCKKAINSFIPVSYLALLSPYSYVPMYTTILSFLGFHKKKMYERGYVGLSHCCLQALSKTMATYISLCK